MLIKTIIRLQVKAQSANMGPPLGPALGQFGVSAMDFVRRFNEESVKYVKGTVLTTIVNVYANRTFDILIKGPILSSLLNLEFDCDRFNGSLKYFVNRLFINNYIIFELFLFLNKYRASGLFFCRPMTEYGVKSLIGYIRSLGFLYYYEKS